MTMPPCGAHVHPHPAGELSRNLVKASQQDQSTVSANPKEGTMSWIFILVFALSVFFLLMYFLTRFVNHMKEEQNLQIESLKETLIDKDNPVGLSGEELQKLKQQQAEAQAHLREVISKIPVIEKDGKFQVDYEAVKKQKEDNAARVPNGSPSPNGNS